MKNSILKTIIFILIAILASVSASAMSADTNISSVQAPLNNSIQTGIVTWNLTSALAVGDNITTVNYTLTRIDAPGLAPFLFCTNTTLNGNNLTQCTNNTASFPDAIYNVTIGIYNATATSSAISRISNVSLENYGPVVNLTSPGANGTQLVDANFLNRKFEINFTLLDNLAAHGNRSFICELHAVKNKIGNFLENSTTLIENRTTTFTNGSNLTFKVASSKILLNGSESVYQVSCRNSAQAAVYNRSLIQNLTVSDVVRPFNVSKPIFKDTEGVVQTKFGFGDTVNIGSCSGTDNVDEAGQFNLTIKFPGLSSFSLNNVTTTFTETQTLGIYTVNCSVSDSNGNIDSNSSDFEITPKVRETVEIKIEKPIAQVLVAPGTTSEISLTPQGEARLMTEDSSLRFTFKTVQHTLKIIDISKYEVEIEIRSEPIKIIMKKGDTKQADLDGDGINDLEIKLNTIITKKADLLVTALSQPPPITEKKAGEITAVDQQAPKKEIKINWTPILIIIILIVIIVLIVYYLKGRSGRVKFTPKDLGLQREEFSSYQPPQGFKYPGR
ncbi:hypothetical protein HY498_01595 [Candidatus Woesearchaeota archaeon]|nr:hypothetical protein [Candidatus Woesearchaeota archaeon]